MAGPTSKYRNMNLPVPTPDEVESFAETYESEFGVRLNPEEAWEAATITLQLYCLGTYGLKSEAPEPRDEPPADWAVPTVARPGRAG